MGANIPTCQAYTLMVVYKCTPIIKLVVKYLHLENLYNRLANMSLDSAQLLATKSLRGTQTRRLVLDAFMKKPVPLSQKELHECIVNNGADISLVSVYRILEAFEKVGLVHKHLSSGGYVLCTAEDDHGHHVLLSCDNCGTVEECIDHELCKHEDRIATQNGFIPKSHLSELTGVCSSCS